jgi:hypothetical protein
MVKSKNKPKTKSKKKTKRKKVWCRAKETHIWVGLEGEKRPFKTWVCPDCNRKLEVLSEPYWVHEVRFFVSAHKKWVKV